MPPHVTDRWSDYLGPGALTSLGVALLVATAGAGLPVLWRLRQVLAAGRRDECQPADAILVLGRALADDRPTAVFAARLDHAAALWRAGVAPRVMVTGGLTGRATRSEAAAGRERLLAAGVPGDAILCEDGSRHTLENLYNARETLRRHGWARVVMVSDPLHLARAAALARGLGLETSCSPAPEASPRGLAWWARAAREAFLLHWYHTGCAWSRLVGADRWLARVT
ncbi:MAG TPA: YdcF family protein [Thermoanaerobaculia bacterium]|nr:YdcF family protein [Thermoanaerobaculia bacterium]